MYKEGSPGSGARASVSLETGSVCPVIPVDTLSLFFPSRVGPVPITVPSMQ